MFKFFQGFGEPLKKLVGKDPLGNKYFSFNDGGKERRLVEYVGEDTNHVNLPPVWRQWLYNRRNDPPSEQEVLMEQKKFQAYRKRVEEYEEKDAKLRIEELAERNSNSPKVTTQGVLESMVGKNLATSFQDKPKSSFPNSPKTSSTSQQQEEDDTPPTDVEEFIPAGAKKSE